MAIIGFYDNKTSNVLSIEVKDRDDLSFKMREDLFDIKELKEKLLMKTNELICLEEEIRKVKEEILTVMEEEK